MIWVFFRIESVRLQANHLLFQLLKQFRVDLSRLCDTTRHPIDGFLDRVSVMAARPCPGDFVWRGGVFKL
ncbi:MAG: hypothetical protein C4321_04795 [Chloroflexota bacterium]